MLVLIKEIFIFLSFFCSPKCSEVSDSTPTAQNSGRVCFETNGAQYDFYDLCCGIGPRGNIPACPQNSRNQAPRREAIGADPYATLRYTNNGYQRNNGWRS